MPCVDCDGAMLVWIDLQIRINNLLLQSAEESNACVDAMCRLLAEDCRRILTRLADCPFRHRDSGGGSLGDAQRMLENKKTKIHF
jgi:hypothetical protein